MDFYPYTLDPTNAFYNAIEPYKLENGFFGKRMPFEGTVAGARKPVKIKIHRFSSDLVILSVSVDQIDFDGTIDDLQNIMSIETHRELFNLVRVICSIICSGGKKSYPIQRKLKAYPYVELESSDYFIEDKNAVELLTRHKNPKSGIVHSVISKNDDHQLDGNSILIDRQGILARYLSGGSENHYIKRKFESSHYLFELAISLSHIFEKEQYSSLSAEQRYSIANLIVHPDIVFTKSVTAYKTWQLLLEEFRLINFYNVIEEATQESVEISSANGKKEWSEFKKWTMGILSSLVIVLSIWGGSTIYQEFNPFSDKPVNLLEPPDEVQIDKNGTKIHFDWVDVEGTTKYILIIEKYNETNKRWFSLESGGRHVVSRSDNSLPINDEGYFKWKVFARNNNEKNIAESVWFYFKVKKVKAPNKKMQRTQETRS